MKPNIKTTSRKSNRIFGMTISQITILSVLGCFALILFGVLEKLILPNTKSLSNIQPTSAPQRPTAVIDNYIVGTWLDTWVGTCTITIKKINGSYQMTRLYRDGSGETKFLVVQTVGGTERLIEYPDSPTGDYMVIENGNLVFYDNEGFIYEDYPSRPIEISTQIDQAIQEVEPTPTPTTPPTLVSQSVDLNEWSQLESLKYGNIYSVLLAGKFRTQHDLDGMSFDDQRNTLITELANRTNQPVRYFQSLNDTTLAGAGSLLVFIREAKIHSDQDIKNMSSDDMRNTLIVEIRIRTGLDTAKLQSLSSIELVRMALSIEW